MPANSIETRLIAHTTSLADGTHTTGANNGTGVDCKDAKEVLFLVYLHTDNGAATLSIETSDSLGSGYSAALDLDGNAIATATDAITATGTYLVKILCERQSRYIRPVLTVSGTNMGGSIHALTLDRTHVSAPTVQVADGSFVLVA